MIVVKRKTAVIDAELARLNVDIAALQETRMMGPCKRDSILPSGKAKVKMTDVIMELNLQKRQLFYQ